MRCFLCSQETADIPTHLEDYHPRVPLEMYQAEFPNAPVRGKEATEPPDLKLSVSKAEAEAHPGGREGAMTEKMLPKDERRLFREDVAAMVRDGLPVNHLLIQTAYQSILHRRLSLDFERVQQLSKGGVFPGETFDRMQEVSALISKNRAELEKMRLNRTSEETPLELVEREQALAEQWIVEHQGELTEHCPGCGAILTPPALPHWAFEPIETSVGVEYMVWSRELWDLVSRGVVRLWTMAYVLRTSPEGLRVTAQRRGETWPEDIVLEVEERELRRVLDVKDLQHRVGARLPQVETTSPAPVSAPPNITEIHESTAGLPPEDQL